ncbi:MAG: DUF349 domain-containing protein [Coriobacteriales bacterium]|nr:DUF349 domain-containing protein [Coriobacteriales bacterium]
MESEANITQELTTPEDAAQTEAPVIEEPTVAATDEQPELNDSAASDAEGAAEQSAEEEKQEQDARDTIVATPDVAPARSKIDIARVAKESLIEQAKALQDSKDWRKTTEAQRKLMEDWRAAGFAGKEDNDRLWAEFRAARDAFFTRRDEHYAQLREQQAGVIEVKKQIIQEAREATVEVRNWVKTADQLNELMDRWKAAGNAGRENEHVLWEEFNGIRRDFRNRRKADLAERRTRERENAQAKRAIVEAVQAIAASEEYTRENSDRLRQLNEEYKAIGFAGKPANDTLWAELRAAQNSYWEGNSNKRDQQRREKRSERLQEAVERKSDQIEHLKDQNETLTTRLESTLNPEKVAQIKQWIAENEERASDLKGDIDEIKKQI